MIINQTYGFTFIHIPKSAGTSVTQFLAPLNGPFDLEIGGTAFGEEIQSAYTRRYKLRKHSTLSEAQGAIKIARAPGDMFTFTFVRNPYARLSSVFSFLRRWEEYNPELLRIMKDFSSFQEFIASGIYTQIPGPDGMFRNQCEWLKINGEVPSQMHCFRIEDAETAIQEIKYKLESRGADISLLGTVLPHKNSSQSQRVEDIDLSRKQRSLILDHYAEDFSIFGYSPLK